MDGKDSTFDDPDGRQTWEQVARDVFEGAGGVCCSVITYPTKPDGGPQEPPRAAPDGMVRPVYCWKHERWMSLPPGNVVVCVPEEDTVDLTGGAYN